MHRCGLIETMIGACIRQKLSSVFQNWREIYLEIFRIRVSTRIIKFHRNV